MADIGSIFCEQGEYEPARLAYREAFEIFADLGHRRGIARSLEGLACLAAGTGQAVRALKLAAAAVHIRALISAPLPQAEQAKLGEKLLPAWQALTPEEGRAAWAAGSTMNLERAIQYSFEEPLSAISTSSDR